MWCTCILTSFRYSRCTKNSEKCVHTIVLYLFFTHFGYHLLFLYELLTISVSSGYFSVTLYNVLLYS